MKSRCNTSESESEPSGNKLRAPRATQDSGLSGVSVEMNAWTRRHGSSQSSYNNNKNNAGFPQPRTPDTATAPLGPLPIVPPQATYQSAYRSAPQSPRHSPRHHHQSSQRASSSSSQDGRNSRRGSRGNGSARPTLIPTVGLDGEELYFPLSPAPPKRKSDTGTRLTHGSDSDVLPPDDRNYPVPAFDPAQFQLPPQQEPLPTLQPYRQQQQPSSTHLRIIHASTTRPPSIYWSDDSASNIDSTGGGNGAETATIATSTNPSAFTFYREGTPPPGDRDLSDDDDDDDENDTIHNEKFGRRPSQVREIGLTVSGTRGSKLQKTTASSARAAAGSGGGGGGGGNGRRPGEVDDDDDDDEGGMNREERDLAEFEFVNGRYVPPGLRDGRMPGRKPLSENHEDDDGTYYGRNRTGRQFWYVAAIIFFVILVVAVGVGVGAGIGLSKRNSHHVPTRPTTNATTTASAALSALASATATAVLSGSVSASATASTASTAASATSSSATSTSTSLTDCPAANGTTYKVPGSSTLFLRLCGIDYSGTGAAVDLSHLPATGMDDCMNNCAGTSGCTACGWGPANSSTTSSGAGSSGFEESGKNFQCYMKSTLGSAKTAVKAESDWCFAIIQ